jgi:signal transduction histidine kinase
MGYDAMSLRFKLWLSFAPLLALLAILGGGLIVLLGRVGGRIDAILRENYRSVEAMDGLNEHDARKQYDAAWVEYRKHLDFEQSNITEPGEKELVDDLLQWTETYRRQGERFFAAARESKPPANDYFLPDGRPGPLLESFQQIKDLSGRIRRLNQESMESASRQARDSATTVQITAVLGLLVALAATGFLGWRTSRTILRPIEELTRSAQAVGDGRFDLMVTVETRDEIGGLVTAFNRMTAQLRDLRQTNAARLLRARQASQAAIDSFPDPILMVDADGRVEMANPAARRVLGVDPHPSRNGPAWEAPDRLRAPLAAALRDQKPYLSQSFQDALLYRVGTEERTFIPQILPVSDPYGNTLGAVVVLSDVTRFRLLDEFKSDLAATASHELKTPLAGLRLAIHLLLEEAVGPLSTKQSELLIDARENTERLVRIVDHLLSLARLERGSEPIQLRPENAEELLRAAADRLAPRLAGRRVELAVEPTPPIAADAERLAHALDNLLVNAATYTEEGGRITLSARPTPDGCVVLSVRDSGVGIPSEYVPHVFEKFFRIPGQTRGQGTGLGLAIVREIVAAHGGQVSCVSEPGQGAEFRMLLPVFHESPNREVKA